MVLVEAVPILSQHRGRQIIDVLLKIDLPVKELQRIGRLRQLMAELLQWTSALLFPGLFFVVPAIHFFAAQITLVGLVGPRDSLVDGSAFEVESFCKSLIRLFDLNVYASESTVNIH